MRECSNAPKGIPKTVPDQRTKGKMQRTTTKAKKTQCVSAYLFVMQWDCQGRNVLRLVELNCTTHYTEEGETTKLNTTLKTNLNENSNNKILLVACALQWILILIPKQIDLDWCLLFFESCCFSVPFFLLLLCCFFNCLLFFFFFCLIFVHLCLSEFFLFCLC